MTEIAPDTDTALLLPLEPAQRRWRVGEDSGATFDTDEDFDGLTLTIEILDAAEAARVVAALRHQLGGVD